MKTEESFDTINFVFPFGQPLNKVVQLDQSPRRTFILGVYASAVHARWINPEGKLLVNALAVASEPYIFWRGENAEDLLAPIHLPDGVGKLLPARSDLNGPSGRALDDLILAPLGFQRNDVWLCDLVPHSCMNPSQHKAIEREYLPLLEKFHLPVPSIPELPSPLVNSKRREEILAELFQSKADSIILLGDLPIKWFLNNYDERWDKLADFLDYGHSVETTIQGKPIEVIALAHPRQIAKLGSSSAYWFEQHDQWKKSKR
jgi:uracil-DNA glycosylase